MNGLDLMKGRRLGPKSKILISDFLVYFKCLTPKNDLHIRKPGWYNGPSLSAKSAEPHLVGKEEEEDLHTKRVKQINHLFRKLN